MELIVFVIGVIVVAKLFTMGVFAGILGTILLVWIFTRTRLTGTTKKTLDIIVLGIMAFALIYSILFDQLIALGIISGILSAITLDFTLNGE